MASKDETMITEPKPHDAQAEIPTTSRKRASEESGPVEDAKRQRKTPDEQEENNGGDTLEEKETPKPLDEAVQNSEEQIIPKSTKSSLQALMFSDEEIDNLSSTDSSNSVSDSEDNSNGQADSTADKSSDADSEREVPQGNENIVCNPISNPSKTSPQHSNTSPKTDPSTQESKAAKQDCSSGPLSLIAEAMQSFNLSFPKFEQSNKAADEKEKPEKVDANEESDEADDSEESDDKVEKTEQDDTSKITQKTKKSEGRKRKANWKIDKDDSSSNSSGEQSPSLSSADKTKKVEETDVQPPKEEKVTAFPIKSLQSAVSDKDSDSDDSNWRRKTKSYMLDVNNGRDFFEDDSSFEDDKVHAREYDRINAELSHANILNDYEQVFHEIRKLVDKVPNRFKYDLYSLLYPTLVMVYLRLIASGKFRRGKAFVESAQRYIDDSYVARVENLLTLQSASDLPKKAKKLLANENSDQIVVSMCEETCDLLLILVKCWSPSQQTAFLRHFNLVPNSNEGKPCQHHRIGCATVEKIYWATESVKEKETSPRPMRRKRLKKSKTSPTKNVHMPTGNRLYTPMPKRWDLERQKDDEEHRVALSRESLPSAYVYTTMKSMETVVCATFSHTSTMLCVGTTSATIHIFSLTPSKLVQLKPANCLKKLDTSMSGIDESMLDLSNIKIRRKLYGHQGPVYGCTFAPNDRFVLTSSSDRTVRCWCLLTWKCVVIYPGHSSAVFCVTYAPFGYYFASGSDDRTARIWTQDNKKSICILVGHLAEVVCCKFHPNRHYLATGSADCTVRLWDIIKALQVRLFTGHRGTISALDYSVCGRYLVSGADDRYIIVWDIDKEQLVQSILYHTAAINCIEFPYDNKIFVVGGQDCQMTVWDFERLVQQYESSKENKAMSSNNKRSELSTEDILIKAYCSKETPFYKLHFTTRNLLLGFCVELVKSVSEESKKPADNGYEEWLTFLDILKLKACFANNKNEKHEMMNENTTESLHKVKQSVVDENKKEHDSKLNETDNQSAEFDESKEIDVNNVDNIEKVDNEAENADNNKVETKEYQNSVKVSQINDSNMLNDKNNADDDDSEDNETEDEDEDSEDSDDDDELDQEDNKRLEDDKNNEYLKNESSNEENVENNETIDNDAKDDKNNANVDVDEDNKADDEKIVQDDNPRLEDKDETNNELQESEIIIDNSSEHDDNGIKTMNDNCNAVLDEADRRLQVECEQQESKGKEDNENENGDKDDNDDSRDKEGDDKQSEIINKHINDLQENESSNKEEASNDRDNDEKVIHSVVQPADSTIAEHDEKKPELIEAFRVLENEIEEVEKEKDKE